MNLNVQDIDLLSQSDLLDSKWYLENYPDVASLGVPAAEHYLRYGTLLMRDPGPRFNTREYLEANPDVADAKVNPLLHYLRFGRAEGRQLRTPEPEVSIVVSEVPVVVSDAPVVVAKEPVPVPEVAKPTKQNPLTGTFERLGDRELGGWAVDASRPGNPVELSIFVDGGHLMNVRTSQARTDVTTEGMNGDAAGFSITFPTGLFAAGASIDVRFAVTGESLADSPRQIDAMAAHVRSAHTQYLDAYRAEAVRPVTVVVPIFNAHDAVAECLASLIGNLPSDAEVLMMDDCSTDPRLQSLLDSYARRSGFRLHRNEANLGYTRSVNKAIALSPGRDVVLLNSDTVVTPRWLHNLRYCAYATPRVATVTAFSNNAGAFSVPEIGVANEIPPHLNTTQFARAVIHAGEGRLLEVPTGNGFCLYLRRAALDAIGVFDESKFPRGYGEENDLCMRALRRGWKNIVSDKALVFHKRSQSFQEEKAGLLEVGNRQVNLDFPEYRLLVERFSDVEFLMARSRVRAAVGTAGVAPLPRVLFVISTDTGGTPQTNLDLMLAMRGHFECMLLRCDASVVTLSRLVGGELREVETHTLPSGVDPVSHRSDHYDQVVLSILYRHSIELLHIRHIAWHGLGLAESAKALGIPIVYSLHDFYSLCPSLNLVDDNQRHCGGVCTPGEGSCQPNLWASGSMPVLKHRFVSRWREMFGQLIDTCDQLITTAPSAVATIGRIYPQAERKLTVIPHGRDFPEWRQLASRAIPREKVRVLVPGNISISKGALLIREMAQLDTEGRFEFHFLGDTAPELAQTGVHHGTYDRAEFGDKVAKILPHIGVVLSVWPETYCHTLTEMWSCGVPVFAIDIGAVGDRIRASGAGWLVDLGATAAEVLNKLRDAVDDAAGYDQRAEAIRCWQSGEGVWNDTAAMAFEYRRVYDRLLQGEIDAAPRRLALLVNSDTEQAVADVRLAAAFNSPGLKSSFNVQSLATRRLLAGDVEHIDLAVTQLEAVPPDQVDLLVDALAMRKVPLVVSITDPFWRLSAASADSPAAPGHTEAKLRLMSRASVVTVPTATLAAQIRGIAQRVVVIPEAVRPEHAERAWQVALGAGAASHSAGARRHSAARETYSRLYTEVTRKGEPGSLKRALQSTEKELARLRKLHARQAALPLVSVIMPTHNRAAIIGKSIATVLEQSHANLELIVCDDASDDDTEQTITRMRDERIRYIKLPKGGAAAARNAGLAVSRGTVIAYLDSDNYWHPDYLLAMVTRLSESPGHSSVYCDFIDFHVDSEGRVKIKSFHRPSFSHEQLLDKPFIDLNSFVHSRELYDCFGGFNPELKRRQDYDLTLKFSWLRDPLHLRCVLTLYQRNDDLMQITRAQQADRTHETIIGGAVERYFKSGLPIRPHIPKPRKVTILSWDLCRNHFSKPFALAEALAPNFEVQLLSFRFFEEEIFPPLKGVKPGFETVYLPGEDFPGFFDAIDKALDRIDGDLIYVVKPRLPSLGLALLANRRKGVPIVLEINDLETVVGKPSEADKHREADFSKADFDDKALRSPYSDLWSQLLDPIAKQLPVLVTHNQGLDQHFDRRCLYMRNLKDERVYDPAAYDRDRIRAELGFSPEDRVILFGGLLRKHKGIYELIELLNRLGDPRYKLLFVGSRPTPDQNRLVAEYGDVVKVLPPQDREAMARINLAADLVILWLNPDVAASHYQFPYKASDAFAMGAAVIANDISDLGDLGRQGYLKEVPFGDWDAMTRAVRELFDNKAETDRMREAARRLYLRQFSYLAARGNFELIAHRAREWRGRVLPVAEQFGRQFDSFARHVRSRSAAAASAEKPAAKPAQPVRGSSAPAGLAVPNLT